MVRDDIRQTIADALTAAQAAGRLPVFELPAIEIARPKQAEHGDYSSNVAMVVAAAIRKASAQTGAANVPPREIAQAIADYIAPGGPVGGVEVAGPGFINIRLADAWLQQQAPAMAMAGSAFGDIDRGRGQRWQVEFVSANPTGPIHYGGARNAVLGDAMANVLAAAGYEVQREYYVNDAGTQFQLFAETLYARYLQLFGRDEPVPAEGYQGEYMIGYAQQIVDAEGDRFLAMNRTDAVEALKPIGEGIVVAALQEELGKLGVRFDRWFREQSLYDDGLVELVLQRLRGQGDLAERDGAVWFLASNYRAKDKDEVLIRSTGAPTYFASDIAYHYEKFVRRGFDHVVNVWSVDHQGHVPRMASVMQALGLDPTRLTILLYGLVKLIRDGQEVRLSKRKGAILSIGEVVDEVGPDAVRFNLLTRGPESMIEFDLDLAKAQNDENPVFYVQYSHARICSIIAKALETGLGSEDEQDTAQIDTALLSHPAELALIRKLLELEEQIELAVEKLSPHNLTHYALELGRTFSAFYRDCRVVDPQNEQLSAARLVLCRAAQVGLKKTLALIGVSAPESM
ncbi:MAG: arginine--tRNA ligase [Caldilineaceae bacterium]